MITRDQLEQRLSEAGIAWHRLDLSDSSSIIVSAHGGRIYGPFHGAVSESVNWIPQAFATREAFADLLASGFWNVGGERLWIGPEIRYMIPDRSDYWGSYTMPPQLDPGVHTLEPSGDGVRLSSQLVLESFLDPLCSVSLKTETFIATASNPLRQLTDFEGRFADIHYSGYSSTVRLTQRGELAVASESWNLNQVPPGGVALIPTVPLAEVTDYYEAVGDHLQRLDGGLAITLSGSQRFKIGVKSAQNFGRVGHLRREQSPDAFVLLVRSFPNDPSAQYTEEPDFAEGVSGDSVHLYNDDGGLGGFGELEARGRTVGQRGGQTESIDRFTTWCYRGSHQQLAAVAQQLLGISPPAPTETHKE
jgi:hypothetical protein